METKHKRYLFFGLFAIFILIFAASAFAANETNVSKKVKKSAQLTNFSFSNCILDAVKTRNDCFNVTKSIFKTCMDETAYSKNNTATKYCGSEYKKSMSSCQVESKKQKKECRLIKHTAWEGFKSYFQ